MGSLYEVYTKDKMEWSKVACHVYEVSLMLHLGNSLPVMVLDF